MSAARRRSVARGTPVSVPARWVAPSANRRRRVIAWWLGAFGLSLLVSSIGVMRTSGRDVASQVDLFFAEFGVARLGQDDELSLQTTHVQIFSGFDVWNDFSINLPLGYDSERIADIDGVLRTTGDGVFRAWNRRTEVKFRVAPEGGPGWPDELVEEIEDGLIARMVTRHALSEEEVLALETRSAVRHEGLRLLRIAEVSVWAALLVGAAFTAWACFVLIVLGTRDAARERWFARDPLTCRNCGYGLAGLPIGTKACPECNARLYPHHAPRTRASTVADS